MEALQDMFQQLTGMVWSDYLDIVLVAYLIYRILRMIRTTTTMRIAKAVVAIIVVSLITDLMNLYTLHFLINQVMAIGLVTLVVLFQPELRRMLDHLGSTSLRGLLGRQKQTEEMDHVISQTVMACDILSRQKVGALIVFARNQSLDDYFKTGTIVNGVVSEQLIRNIFFPNASLHDGAMIVRDGKIAACGCVLPLSESNRLSADLGTRHRAGVGMSEVSDAVVVIVSEETGTISVAVGGMLKRHLAPQTLERLLRMELCRDEGAKQQTGFLGKIQQKLQKGDKNHEK